MTNHLTNKGMTYNGVPIVIGIHLPAGLPAGGGQAGVTFKNQL